MARYLASYESVLGDLAKATDDVYRINRELQVQLAAVQSQLMAECGARMAAQRKSERAALRLFWLAIALSIPIGVIINLLT